MRQWQRGQKGPSKLGIQSVIDLPIRIDGERDDRLWVFYVHFVDENVSRIMRRASRFTSPIVSVTCADTPWQIIVGKGAAVGILVIDAECKVPSIAKIQLREFSIGLLQGSVATTGYIMWNMLWGCIMSKSIGVRVTAIWR
jgi:hypothetical protein